ncbi:hypothetical protein MRB53_037269 [Persea americana]|nr:hypothetical protein MRB53_037269 [Persea americana]
MDQCCYSQSHHSYCTSWIQLFCSSYSEVLQEFDVHNEALATWVLSVYVLGFAIGPFIFAPSSELYGRMPVYHGCNLLYICFSVGAALAPNMAALIVFRLFQGTFGSAALTNGGGTISDIMPAEKRGSAMSIWAIGPLLGLYGPSVIDLELTRWQVQSSHQFAVVSCQRQLVGDGLCGFLQWHWSDCNLGSRFHARDLCSSTSREEDSKTAKRDRKYEPHVKARQWTRTEREIQRAIYRPSKLLFLSPICTFIAIYFAITYGVLYLLFSTFTFVFEDTYHFSQSIVGLTFIGIGAGSFTGLFILGMISDPLMKRLAAKHSNGELKPEYRLPPMIITSPLLPIGMFIYGWTAQYGVHWIVPLIGTFLVGISLISVFMCVSTYVVDAYTKYAASAMAANTFLRSIFGAVFHSLRFRCTTLLVLVGETV